MVAVEARPANESPAGTADSATADSATVEAGLSDTDAELVACSHAGRLEIEESLAAAECGSSRPVPERPTASEAVAVVEVTVPVSEEVLYHRALLTDHRCLVPAELVPDLQERLISKDPLFHQSFRLTAQDPAS